MARREYRAPTRSANPLLHRVGDDGLTREERKAKLSGQAPEMDEDLRSMDKRMHDAVNLLVQALDSTRRGELESALWRTVDAAGLLSSFVDDQAEGMPMHPTGRGFSLNTSR